MHYFLFSLLFSMASATVDNHDKIVGCYFGAWAVYRNESAFDVEDIDPTLCTHGYYGFADIDNSTWKIKIIDPWYDIGPNDCTSETGAPPQDCKYDSYRRFVKLKEKNPDFVPIISIGGWNAGSASFSQMSADPVKRTTFIDSAIALARKYGFEGIDFDWEYPGSREGSDPINDKQNFNLVITEFRQKLDQYGMILTAAVNPGYKTIEIGYDIPVMAEQFHFINIMTYDYHGAFEDHDFTGHNAPLYQRKEEDVEGHPGYLFNMVDSLKIFMDGGMPVEKIVMGIPLYGRGFYLKDNEKNGLYCDTIGPLPKGPVTGQDGMWGYHEVLRFQQNSSVEDTTPEATPLQWQIVKDNCYQAPYMSNGPYWIGYDDEESVRVKMGYANKLGLAGAFVWSVDTDDFLGDYSDINYPLLRAINDGLADDTLVFDPEVEGCESAPSCGYEP